MTSTFCSVQQIKPSSQLTCEEYLTKKQKPIENAARVLLIGGGVLIIVPVLIAIPGTTSFDDLETFEVIVGIGVASSFGKYSVIHRFQQK